MIPKMGNILAGFAQTGKYFRASREMVGFKSVETLAAPVLFRGVFQPMKVQSLLIKPEGERRWKWFTLHTTKEMFLGDAVEGPEGTLFKVMQKSDWSGSRFFVYELTERPNVL